MRTAWDNAAGEAGIALVVALYSAIKTRRHGEPNATSTWG